jgi:hypothetical protein
MDSADVGVRVSVGNIHLEVANTTQEVVRIQIPEYMYGVRIFYIQSIYARLTIPLNLQHRHRR